MECWHFCGAPGHNGARDWRHFVPTFSALDEWRMTCPMCTINNFEGTNHDTQRSGAPGRNDRKAETRRNAARRKARRDSGRYEVGSYEVEESRALHGALSLAYAASDERAEATLQMLSE